MYRKSGKYTTGNGGTCCCAGKRIDIELFEYYTKDKVAS
ncbi:MAG: hypothetical protein A4E52_01266 [Pelotomaculum sp. PtaB.Bin013]|nr:MAG: hypothetical protein A4E52_01266 [Pelotomaculum sp. PtaB.Bin013]